MPGYVEQKRVVSATKLCHIGVVAELRELDGNHTTGVGKQLMHANLRQTLHLQIGPLCDHRETLTQQVDSDGGSDIKRQQMVIS